MKKIFKILKAISVLLIIVLLFFAGCVNYEQNAILKKDGSGSMKLHYWSRMRSLEMGSTLGKLEFDEIKARNKYSSVNNEVTSIKVEDNLLDSTRHVNIELTFKDINKISDAIGFESTKAIWKENAEGMELKYVVLKDTGASKQMNASNFNITFEFMMPSEIISTNGTKDGLTVKFSYTLADLVNDLEMTTVVK